MGIAKLDTKIVNGYLTTQDGRSYELDDTPLEIEWIKGGFQFKQIAVSDFAYLYEVSQTTDDITSIHYEVFRAMYGKKYQRNDYKLIYPSNESFGTWAWCIRNKDRAIAKFNEIKK